MIDRVVFQRPETGYCVLRLAEPGGERFVLLATVPEPREGELVRARGVWRDDPSWGRQFVASSLEILPPSSPEALADYLASGIVPGLGPKTAARLVERFGTDLPDILERSPERLREVRGLKRGLADRLVEAWRAHRAGRDLLLFLHAHGVGLARARTVLEAWGPRALDRITADPYALAREIQGVGFRTADALARRLGLAQDAPARLVGALEETLRRAAEEGHTALDRSSLLAGAGALLDGPVPGLEAALDRALADGNLHESTLDGERWVQLPELARAEEGIVRELARLLAVPIGWRLADPAAAVEAALGALGLDPSPEQRTALEAALSHKLLVVTGGPGTGKTTLVRAILAGLEGPRIRVALAAPTGRAAKRLAESTGREAKTLHRLLEAEPARGFRRGRGRPLEYDLLIVDEVSMVDTLLMRATLEALPDGAALVLVGDADQLPSVGPGQVLADLLACPAIPAVRLHQVFRQAAESGIVRNAHRILRGELPELARGEDPGGDFFGMRVRDPEEAADRIVALVAERIPERFGHDPWSDIQVLSPVNRGPLGVRALNRRLQERLNPSPADAIERSGQRLGVGDKVMQLANDYERDVYNGDLGRIGAIDRRTRTVEVVFDGRALTYGFDELDALAPAFAATVHKAQGSEYPAVVLALARAHGRMLNRRLLYTAITRARRLVVLVAEPAALARAVREGGGPARKTLLGHRLSVLQARPDRRAGARA
ncbi:MAG: ATP-dependent RecD-like DNA helicase [Geminicoccaceae bacterium]|nr:ATP-dependent RecD-like DNA helicase [Geminicoccaceae bacterium]MCX8099835.1 ATP-dependent RecD-like DNA helicase [Geminicoccaceae bacterium]MDW8369751.1 ATP-dependent RecD-like DNA helicase [Geminicoccaceae bacterium]